MGPVVVFYTALNNLVTVTPVSIVVTEHGDSEEDSYAVCACASESASGFRCNRFTVDDPALDVSTLNDKLRRYEEFFADHFADDGGDGGRRLFGGYVVKGCWD